MQNSHIFFVQIMIYLCECFVCKILCFFFGWYSLAYSVYMWTTTSIILFSHNCIWNRFASKYSLENYYCIGLPCITLRCVAIRESHPETNSHGHLHYFHFVYYLNKNKFNRMSDTIKFLIKLNYVTHFRTE